MFMPQATTKIFLLLCGLVSGWASALYFIDDLGSAVASPNGHWRMWNLGAGTSSNPYAVAHFLLAGQVPPAQSLFRIYTSSRDDDGNRLRSECVYMVSASSLPARWWSLSVEPSDIPDNASTPVITSDEIARGLDGSMIIAVARHPIPGNWVRPGHDGNIELQMLVSNDGGSQEASSVVLPAVQRVGC
jgi:hypothetical protein